MCLPVTKEASRSVYRKIANEVADLIHAEEAKLKTTSEMVIDTIMGPKKGYQEIKEHIVVVEAEKALAEVRCDMLDDRVRQQSDDIVSLHGQLRKATDRAIPPPFIGVDVAKYGESPVAMFSKPTYKGELVEEIYNNRKMLRIDYDNLLTSYCNLQNDDRNKATTIHHLEEKIGTLEQKHFYETILNPADSIKLVALEAQLAALKKEKSEIGMRASRYARDLDSLNEELAHIKSTSSWEKIRELESRLHEKTEKVKSIEDMNKRQAVTIRALRQKVGDIHRDSDISF